MNKTQSDCRRCQNYVYPSEIKPPWRRRARHSRQRHSCDAPDCGGHDHYADDNDVTQDVANIQINPRAEDPNTADDSNVDAPEVTYLRNDAGNVQDHAINDGADYNRRSDRNRRGDAQPGSYRTGTVLFGVAYVDINDMFSLVMILSKSYNSTFY